MRIGGFLKNSLIDYPGKIAAVVFTQGCNWRCPYCHNQELVEPACFGEGVPMARVLNFLQKRRDVLDGVVVSGGEPTIHADLPDFLQKLKELGYAVKLDTNGSNAMMLRDVIHDGLVDFLAMDVKAPLNNYAAAAGKRIDPEEIRTSIWLVKNSGVEHEFRTTVVPGLHTVNELKAIGSLVHGAGRFALQAYEPEHARSAQYRERGSFPAKAIERLQPFFARRVGTFIVREKAQAEAGKEGVVAGGVSG